MPIDQTNSTNESYERFVEENLRRNYFGHFLHGMLGMTGFRMVNTPTFLPAFVFSLSGSNAIVGLAQSLQQLGAVFSPIVGATQIEHRKRILPVSTFLGSMMRLQLLGLAIAGWFATGQTALWLVLSFIFLLGVFQGSQRVAFQLLMAKVIPVRLRGRLNGWRNLAGGLVAAILSYIAGDYLVANEVLGNGYATTLFIAFGLTTTGLIVLNILMREPEPPTVRAQVRFSQRVKEFPALLKEDEGFAWFMVARTFAMGVRIGQPFFFLFAASLLGISPTENVVEFGKLLAAFSLAYMAADTFSNLLWGYLADRGGFRSTLVISMILNLAAITVLMMTDNYSFAIIAFVGLGAAQAGYIISTTNIVMEFGHRHDMAMRMAFSNTAEGAMGTIAPLFGGLLVLLWGYNAAFIATLISIAIALFVTVIKVDEPRRRQPSE